MTYLFGGNLADELAEFQRQRTEDFDDISIDAVNQKQHQINLTKSKFSPKIQHNRVLITTPSPPTIDEFLNDDDTESTDNDNDSDFEFIKQTHQSNDSTINKNNNNIPKRQISQALQTANINKDEIEYIH